MARPKLRVVRPQHTLIYGLRLVPGEALEEPADQPHPRVAVTRPDGGTEWLTVHTITGDREEIRRKLLESVDAFFEIVGDDLG